LFTTFTTKKMAKKNLPPKIFRKKAFYCRLGTRLTDSFVPPFPPHRMGLKDRVIVGGLPQEVKVFFVRVVKEFVERKA